MRYKKYANSDTIVSLRSAGHADDRSRGYQASPRLIASAFLTSKSFAGDLTFEECRLPITAFPTSLHCYRVGRNITSSLDVKIVTGKSRQDEQIKLFASQES
jgi:hypothetical protein